MLTMRWFLASLVVLSSGAAQLYGQAPPPLRRVDLIIDSLADSGSYRVYSYRMRNGQASRGGAAILSIDVAAPKGTGFVTLPATGKFDHGAGYPHVDLTRFQDHVPLGPISPPNWRAFLTRSATLDWFGTHGGFEGDIDSIAPGDSLDGFALRSSYLPGIRRFWAAPTFKSCCTQLRPPGTSGERENPNPSEFKIQTWTVGPTVRPADMTLALLRSDLDQVCGSLRWIADGALCGTLQAQLAQTAAAGQHGDRAAVADALRLFHDAVEGSHGPGKPVNDNAYWLLKVNAQYLLNAAR